jgi:DNA-binding CsgD family transcriptional regulator/Flp pilus assembly protein TadD
MPFDHSVVCPILIGHATHIESLQRTIDAARGGQGRTIILAGEAGVGKTRLVAETKTRAAQSGFRLLQGSCFEPDRALPYAPLLDALRIFIAAGPADEIARDFGPSAPELVKLLPELTALLPDLVPAPPLEPEQEKRRLFQSLAQFVFRLAARQGDYKGSLGDHKGSLGDNKGSLGDHKGSPLLVVVEDLHWSDDTSLEFLLYLARRIASHPILLLLTYRSDETHPGLTHFLAGLDREHLATEIALTRMTRAETEAMLRAIFDLKRPVRAEFLDAIYTLTEGTPFFVEEILKALMVAGEIFYADGVWDRKPIGELHIPRSVHDAVHRRSARLSPPAKHLLVLAAAVGRRFDFPLLQEFTGHDENALLQLIKELIAAQLVVEESADQFAFRHALTRQAIYAALLARERKALHRTIAETMERVYAESLAPSAGSGQAPSTGSGQAAHWADLALHFFEAGAWDKVLEYAPRAGEKASSLYAPRAAVEHFTRALDAARQLPTRPPLTKLHRARGQAYDTLGEFERARADYTTALELARAAGDRQEEWQALLDLGALWASRDYAQSGDYLRQALALARASGDLATIAHSLNRVGNWEVNAGQPRDALQYHREALEIFQALNDRRGVAQTLDLLGMACNLGGDPAQSNAYYEQAVALFRELDDRQGLASSLTQLAFGGGIFQRALGEEAIAIAQDIGWRSGEAYARIMLGLGLGFQGEYARGLDLLRSGLNIAEEIEHREWTTAGHCYLGMLYVDLLALPEAQQHLERAQALAHEIRSSYWVYAATMALASARIADRDLTGAEAVLQAAFGPYVPGQPIAPQGLLAQVELELARGDGAAALPIVDQLSALMANMPDNAITVRLSKWRGEALAALHREAEAEAALQSAQQAAEAQGVRPMVWRVLVALGRLYRSQARREEAERAFSAARTVIAELAALIPDSSLHDNFQIRATALIPPTPPLSARQAAKKEFGGLTDREREVAALIAQGKSNREVAEALVVGERTVEAHVSNILSKLGFTSRAQIAVWAAEKGLGKDVDL